MGRPVGGGERPGWALRIKAERQARGWSQAQAVARLREQAAEPLPSDGSLLRNWKRWEAGDAEPDAYYKPLIAKAFGTVTAAFFPRSPRLTLDAELLTGSGLDTLELVARLRTSDVSQPALDGLRIAADRLCCDYPHLPAEALHAEGLAWLRRITALLDRRLTLTQHREVLSLAGLVALLVGCVEYDMGKARQAEATRQAALSLGTEAGDTRIQGWAHEMRAWFALTRGDYRTVITAAETGEALAPAQSVAVQLAAQRAKAWARLGDQAQVEQALDQGRTLLETLPEPQDLDHHFVVDPSKFDFYAMDCYRRLPDDRRARVYADEVIRSSCDPDGRERHPMRAAEARLTLAILAARDSDLEQALSLGETALRATRKSLPSLGMCAQELRTLIRHHHPTEKHHLHRLDDLLRVPENKH